MISQAEADRICDEANRLEQLARDLNIGQDYFEDRVLLDEIQNAVEMLRRYVCGGLVIEFHRSHKYMLQQQFNSVSILEEQNER